MRLTFLCHASTHSMREGGFPAMEEPLDDGGRRKAERYGRAAEPSASVRASPARAACETAEILGVPMVIDDALRDIDYGRWTGRSFAALGSSDPDGLMAWIADPAGGAPGGETFATIEARIGSWLRATAEAGEPVMAITHPMVIRAALASAIGLPAAAALRIDIAPLASVELSFNRMWRLQAIRPA